MELVSERPERKSIGLEWGVVRLVEHRREWADYYLAESERIRMCAAELIIDVQHVGSTAVPGMVAKPILDIAIAAPDKARIEMVVGRLAADGYVDRGDQGASGGHLLVREIGPNVRTCHIHIVEVNDPQWRNYIAFRDILRHEPAVRSAYEALKKDLAARFPEDRESYTAGKDAFVRDVLREHGEKLP